MCLARHHQLAIGGVLTLPASDKFGNPVRDADGNIIFVEKVVMPSERALEFEIARREPIDDQGAAMPELPGQTHAEQAAAAAQMACLFSDAVQVLVDLGRTAAADFRASATQAAGGGDHVGASVAVPRDDC
jgi:hypothetical protein